MADPTPVPVDKQLVDISLGGGVNERERPELVDWTKYLTTCENVSLSEGGALVQRPGCINIGLTDEVAANYYPLYRLLPQEKGLAFVGKDWSLYDLDESSGFPVAKGRLPEFSVSHRGMSSWGVDADNRLRFAGYTSKYAVLVHASALTGSSYSMWTIVLSDLYSGNIVRKYSLAYSNGTYPNLSACVSGEYLHLLVTGTGGANCYHSVLDLSGTLPSDAAQLSVSSAITGQTNTAITIGVGAGGVTPVGIVPTTGGGCVTAVNDGAGATSVETWSSAGASVATLTIATWDGSGISCTGGTDVYLVGRDTGTGFLVMKVAPTATLVVNRTVTSTVATTSSNVCRVVDDGSGNCRLLHYVRTALVGTLYLPGPTPYTCTSAATDFTAVTLRPLYAWVEASQPFYSATTGRFYVALAKQLTGQSGASLSRDTTLGSSITVFDITEAYQGQTGAGSVLVRPVRPCAVVDTYTPYIANNNQNYGHITSSNAANIDPPGVMVDTYKVYLGVQQRSSTQACSYAIAEMSIRQASKVGSDKDVLATGILSSYDGDAPAELGFVEVPSTFLATVGGAGNVDVGVHNYISVLEYRDMQGRSHYSRMSRPSTLTIGGAATNVTVTVPVTQTSAHDVYKPRGGVQAHVFRTTAGGTVYYYVGTINTYMSQSLTDSTTDAALVSNAQPYRQPGIAGTPLDRFHPLSASCVVRHKDRVFYANGSNVYYSSFAVDGEAPWFNPQFSFAVPGGQGDITALASMDGILVVFKSDAVFVVDGDGPSENGGNGTEFSPPRRILTEFGCPDARMLVGTPDGLMYRSRRGIELLDRSLQVSWIGSRVSTTCDAYPQNSGAVFDSVAGRVLFAVSSSVTAAGIVDHTYATRILAYDVDAKAWSVWNQVVGGTPAENGMQDLGACVTTANGETKRRVFITSEYYPAYFDDSTSLDVGYVAPMKLETGWIRLESSQGRIRVSDFLFLGKKVDNHKLTISVAYDYSSSYSYSKSWEPSVINALGIEQLELELPYQAKMAMRFKVEVGSPTDTVTYPVTTGKGSTVLALSPRLGKRGGQNKLSADQKG